MALYITGNKQMIFYYLAAIKIEQNESPIGRKHVGFYSQLALKEIITLCDYDGLSASWLRGNQVTKNMMAVGLFIVSTYD